MVRSHIGAALLGVMLLGGVAAHAQTPRSGGNANSQLVQQLQQLASERTAMEAEAARNKKELEDVRKERDSLKSAQKALDQRARSSSAALAQATAQRETAEQELKQYKDKMQELIGKFRETIQQLRETETDRTTARQTLATRDRELKVCLDRNAALYKLDDEVLTHMEHESVFSRLAAAEPFTKIKRVQLENLIDDYRWRAEDQRVTPQSIENAARRAAPAPGRTAPAAPAQKAPAAAPAPAPGSSSPPPAADLPPDHP
jgi:chromosome segregation ATPase